MRHWIGDVSNKTIYSHIETDCKVHYSHNSYTDIRYVIHLLYTLKRGKNDIRDDMRLTVKAVKTVKVVKPVK